MDTVHVTDVTDVTDVMDVTQVTNVAPVTSAPGATNVTHLKDVVTDPSEKMADAAGAAVDVAAEAAPGPITQAVTQWLDSAPLDVQLVANTASAGLHLDLTDDEEDETGAPAESDALLSPASKNEEANPCTAPSSDASLTDGPQQRVGSHAATNAAAATHAGTPPPPPTHAPHPVKYSGCSPPGISLDDDADVAPAPAPASAPASVPASAPGLAPGLAPAMATAALITTAPTAPTVDNASKHSTPLKDKRRHPARRVMKLLKRRKPAPPIKRNKCNNNRPGGQSDHNCCAIQ